MIHLKGVIWFMGKAMVIGVFLVFAGLLLCSIGTAFCDPAPPGYYKVEIQGAKVVSEGGYFHFYIRNIGNGNLTVKFLNYTGSEVFLEPNASVTYKVIAPQINSLYQNVTYVFQISYGYPPVFENCPPYTVTVVKADLIRRIAEMERQLSMYILLLMATVGICLLIGTLYIAERCRRLKMQCNMGKRFASESCM